MGDGTASPIAGGEFWNCFQYSIAAGHAENISFGDRQTKEFSEFFQNSPKFY